MGIVKISDALHEDVRKASVIMVRSINAQAEYWMKIGMLAEANPSMSFSQIISEQLHQTVTKCLHSEMKNSGPKK
ncbi:MAG: ParD-like family protein [Candidatus Thiodiazotropha sp.]|jgi:hypothetical protein